MRSTTKRRISEALKRYWRSSPRKRSFPRPRTVKGKQEKPIRYFGQYKTIRLYSAPQKTITKGSPKNTLPVKKD